MRFSILSVVLLFLPVAFFSLWLSEYLARHALIEWERFTVDAMERHIDEGRRVLILGSPKGIVEHFSLNAMAEFDTPLLRQHCANEDYAMLKLDYTPWGESKPSIQAELAWMSEHGGYKEPSLVRVEPDGQTNALKHIIGGGRISGFLLGDQTTTRKTVYLELFALTFVCWVTFSVFGKRMAARFE